MAFATAEEYGQACDRLTAANTELDTLLAIPEGDDARELTAEEHEQVTTLDAECEELEPEVTEHKAKLENLTKLRLKTSARRNRLENTSRGRQTTPSQLDTPDPLEIPAAGSDGAEQLTRDELMMVKRAGTLRAFKGLEARYDAYASGQWWLARLAEPGSEMQAKAARWCDDHLERLAQSTTDNTKGGALVPDSFDTTVIDLRDQYGVARREFNVKPMTSDSDTQPRRVSGPTAYFMGDNSLITESDKDWDQVQLIARKIGCLSKISSELNEDAIIKVADDLAQEFAYAFAKKEDQCGFLGDGTSTYCHIRGLITQCTAATAGTVTAATTHTAFSTLTLTDFMSMIGKLPDYAENGAKWYISKAGFAASMMALVAAAGGNTAEMLAGKVRRYFLGYEVVTVSVMNSTLTAQVSTKGICYLGDLNLAATLGDRRGIRTITSRERYMEYDQIGIQGTQRFAMNVHDVGDTSTAGPVIMLATPSS